MIATRKPFQVYVWTDRSYYEAGQAITVSVKHVPRVANIPSFDGHLAVIANPLTPDGKPSETLVQEWPLTTDAQQRRRKRSKRPRRTVSSQVVMGDGERSVEAGQLLVIRGKKDKPTDFRFSGLELTPNQPHYKVGDHVRLLISADHATQ